MTAQEFAKTNQTDADWVAAMGDRQITALATGQRGTYSGFSATVIRHYHNGMYEIRVPGGPICVCCTAFVPA